MTLITLVALLLVLGMMGEMELHDQQQTADLVSNARHIAALEPMERQELEAMLARVGNEMPEHPRGK